MTDKPRVYIRKVQRNDEEEFVKLMRESISIHEPWISPPHSPALYKYYMQRLAREDHEGFVICPAPERVTIGARDEIYNPILVLVHEIEHRDQKRVAAPHARFEVHIGILLVQDGEPVAEPDVVRQVTRVRR